MLVHRTCSCVKPREAHRPNVSVMPVNDRVYSHKVWPAVICSVKVRQFGAMGISPSSSHEYRFNSRVIAKVLGEAGFHGLCVCNEIQ